MRKLTQSLLGLFAACLLTTAVDAQGLLGEPYLRLGGGYVRLDGPEHATDGVGAIASVNAPVVLDRLFGLDFHIQGSYMRHRGRDNLSVDHYDGAGLFRVYAPWVRFVNPYAEVGLGWSSTKFEMLDESRTDSGLIMPLGAGVQLLAGRYSLTPFFTYVVGLDDDLGETWSAGAKATYWVNPEWGLTLTAMHTDLDRDFDRLSILAGVIFSF